MKITIFKCYDCNVKSSGEKEIRKITLPPNSFLAETEDKIVYECGLGLCDCRNLTTLLNSEVTASYVRKIREEEREEESRFNKHPPR